jgi:hypothetical protein
MMPNTIARVRKRNRQQANRVGTSFHSQRSKNRNNVLSSRRKEILKTAIDSHMIKSAGGNMAEKSMAKDKTAIWQPLLCFAIDFSASCLAHLNLSWQATRNDRFLSNAS